ncbi:MAG: PaaI family thioesterase [Myxococcaceae bacterium]|nr:PaaI family thioesterase [Myxococcaceae bacterium]
MSPEARVRRSFERQRVMATFGVELLRVAPGEVDLRLPFREDLTQQHGFFHAGVLATVVDSACGWAALTLMPEGAGVLSIEFKVNLLTPARGDAVIAKGRVVKAGRTISVVQGDVFALAGEKQTLCTTLTGTMMVVQGRPELAE